MWDDYDDRDTRRTLGIRDKKILYRRANKKCENPGCARRIEFDEMQVGHKTSWSRGGRTTIENSVCLCWRCNSLQGTDSWATFLRKQGVESPQQKLRKSLQALDVGQLKTLAKKHGVRVKGQLVEDLFDSYRAAPTKSQYVSKLVGQVTQKEVDSFATERPKVPLRKLLQTLGIEQLKTLATKHGVRVSGRLVEDWFDSYRVAPTKSEYIGKLVGLVTEKEINSIRGTTARAPKRKPG